MFRYIPSEKNFRQQSTRLPKKPGLLGFLRKKEKRIIYTESENSADKTSLHTNPFRRVEEKRRLPILIKIIFLLIILLSWITLAIYLPYFRINKIVYYGLDIIQKDEIENYLRLEYLDSWSLLPHDNYFLASTGEMTRMLNQKYSLERVELRKKFPNILEVDLKEKISSAVYDNGEKYFLLDDHGTALKYLGDTGFKIPVIIATTTTSNASSTVSSVLTAINHKPDYLKIKNSFGNYPIIFDTRFLSVEEKQINILSPKIIAGTILWRDLIEKEGIGSVKYFITDNPLAGLGAVTNKGITIYWQPENDLNSQLLNLKTVLQNEQPGEYVDLRYGERVYWK